MSRFLLGDGVQCIDLAVPIERVIADVTLTDLRRAIVHRWEERID